MTPCPVDPYTVRRFTVHVWNITESGALPLGETDEGTCDSSGPRSLGTLLPDFIIFLVQVSSLIIK